MDERNEQAARAIIEKAQAQAGLITVLTRHLESRDDLLAKIAAAELRDDPNWRAFTKGIRWYARWKRAIRRNSRGIRKRRRGV